MGGKIEKHVETNTKRIRIIGLLFRGNQSLR